jgi:hypothetical protein
MLDPQVPNQQEDIEKTVPTAPGLEGERIGRLKNERLTWIVDLCRLAKVGKRPSPKPHDDLMPSWITRADSDKEQLFCGCNKINRRVVHDKKSSGRNVLHAC